MDRTMFDFRDGATASGAADASESAVRDKDEKFLYEDIHATASGAADASDSTVLDEDDRSTTGTFNILQLNINGTQKKKNELHNIMLENEIHIASLQETKLNKNLKFDIKGYRTIRKDRLNRSGGGLAFLIKNNIKYKEITVPTNDDPHSNTELQALRVFFPGHTILLINVYHPDNSNINIQMLDSVCKNNPNPVIMLGDFNAKSPTWGSSTLDEKGKQIEDLLIDAGLSILNDKQPTFLSRTTGTESALDLTAVSYQISNRCSWRVLKSAMSDHRPIITSLSEQLEPEEQLKRSWNFRKANWTDFTSSLDELCRNATAYTNLDQKIQSFNKNINLAAKKNIPRGKRKKHWIPYWKDAEIDSLITERDDTHDLLKRNNTAENRKKLSDLTKSVEEKIAECKRRKWTEFCSTLDPKTDTKHWKVAKALNGGLANTMTQTSNIILSSNETADTNKKSANLLVDHYSKMSKLDFKKEDKKFNKKVRRILLHARSYKILDNFSKPIAKHELDSAIHQIPNGKSPGPDLIFGEMVKHFGEVARDCLLDIINISWRKGKLPKIWKNSTIVPIPKPGKSAEECKSYRPIALTSILCKVMERIVHNRVMTELLKEKKRNFYQTAYRKQHSTEDQLLYLCQSIIDGLQDKPHKKSTVVFLDMTSAFDTVWRGKLLKIAHEIGIQGNALIWISDFLKNRKIRVRFNGVYSRERKTWGGVPQGSVLSPLLFLIYVNNIHPHLHKETKVACYADDIAIWHTDENLEQSERSLNCSLRGILEWSNSLKLRINPQKTSYSIFSTDRKHRRHFSSNLVLNNQPLVKTENPVYLGLTLDAELRFSEHIKKCANKSLKKLKILKSLCGTDWGANPKTLKTTYTTLIRPIMEYASPIWSHASNSALEKIDNIQARAAKIITGAVSSTNNIKSQKECGLQLLENRRKYSVVKLTNKIRSCEEDHIGNRVFQKKSESARLKRSSTLQYYQAIRHEIGLEHHTHEILQESSHTSLLPPTTKIEINLLEPCSKKELTSNIRDKGIRTIESYSSRGFVCAFTDGSSDKTLENGGAGIKFIFPDGSAKEVKLGAGKIASNYTCELLAIQEALNIYSCFQETEKTGGLIIFSDCKAALQAIQKGYTKQIINIHRVLDKLHTMDKQCILQWIPAHVGIEGNEAADVLAKEARDLNEGKFPLVTLNDINAVAKSKCKDKTIKLKHQICELTTSRSLAKTLIRLRTGHLGGMKIQPDGTRTYPGCKNCDNTELSPEHVLSCPAILAKIQKISGSPFEDLHSDNCLQIAEAVWTVHGPI